MIQDIGSHRVSCRPVQYLDMDELMGGEKAHIFYSDPPWNDGSLKYWNTMRTKQSLRHLGVEVERAVEISFSNMLEIYKRFISKYVDGFVFIEVGHAQEVQTKEMLDEVLKSNIVIETLRYRSGSKMLTNVILYGSVRDNIMSSVELEGMNGAAVSREAIETCAQKDKIVFDPMCGMGYTAQAAIDNGMRFVGNEFNEHRLGKTIDRLRSAVL